MQKGINVPEGIIFGDSERSRIPERIPEQYLEIIPLNQSQKEL